MKKKKADIQDADLPDEDETAAQAPPAEDDKHTGNGHKIHIRRDGEADADQTGRGAPDSGDGDPVAHLKEALAAAEKEKEAINDRFLRAAADFDNYKKRLDRQWVDFKKYANESLAREMLTVVDNLERAIAAAAEEGSTDNTCLIAGVRMTLDEILKILERFGVTPIKAAGEKFDPNYHQAVSTRKEEAVEENIVLEEFQKGYLMHDRLLRPAMVVVSASG